MSDKKENEMIISVDTFIAKQGEGIFYTVDDDIITGRGTDDLVPEPYHHREVYDDGTIREQRAK